MTNRHYWQRHLGNENAALMQESAEKSGDLLDEMERVLGEVREAATALRKALGQQQGDLFDKLTEREREDLPYAVDEGQTHFPYCYMMPGHHNCAVMRIFELEKELGIPVYEDDPKD